MKREKIVGAVMGILVILVAFDVLLLSNCGKRVPITKKCVHGGKSKPLVPSDKARNSENPVMGVGQEAPAPRRPILPRSGTTALLEVFDGKGNPISGAEVSKVDCSKRIDVKERRRIGFTNARGEFAVHPGALGRNEALLVIKDLFLHRLVRSGEFRKKRRVRIVLETGEVGVFKFMTPDNFPVQGVRFSVSSVGIRSGYCMHGGLSGPCSEKSIIFSGTTGPIGEIRFSSLRPGWGFVDVYKEGFAVQDIRPKPIKFPGGPFLFTMAPLFGIFGKVDGPAFFSSFFKPPKGCRGRIIMGFPSDWVSKKIKEGYVCSLFTRKFSLSQGWLPVPKKVPLYFLFDKLGWRKLAFRVRPFSFEMKPEILKVRVPQGVDRLGYVVVKLKAGKEDFVDLEMNPPRLLFLRPIRLRRPGESPRIGSPFGFNVLVRPGKRIGVPEGAYRLLSSIPCIKKILPRNLKIVSVRGETRSYEIDLRYQLAPVFLRFRFQDGSYGSYGRLMIEAKGLDEFTIFFSPEEVLWLPCTEIHGTFLPFQRESPGKKFSFKVKIAKAKKPVVLEVPLWNE